ncbi:phosphoenolpyruvate--protein phosphotransferase [Eubacteriales bacterium OttesenSCG-928-M02]|nr:phosphoenolpyruvate--protein phosphotransferase [Eubacteriales bacterium OttesenSCG-928-M02]
MKGIIASPGVAIGKAFVLSAPEIVIDDAAVSADQVELEVEKFRAACAAAEEQLNDIIVITEERLSSNEADVFRAHLMMLADPTFEDAVLDKIQNSSYNAGKAVSEATAEVAAMLASLDDEYLKERAADIKDVGGRVLDNVLGVVRTSLSDLTEPVVVFANDLTPSDTATMNLDYVMGFATDIGGRTSHTSILARIIGIPAIVGTGDITQQVAHGDQVILDAVDGDIVINPTADQLPVYQAKLEKYLADKRALDEVKLLPAVTTDGHHVEIVANIASPSDVKGALENGAEGCGLFRTEFLYMNRTELPPEEMQYEAYKEVLEGFGDKPVVIRTVDIGGDKAAECIEFPEELNPFLGWRAIRMCFDRLDVIKPQMRALLRASLHGKLHVMYPMIISAEEITKMEAIVDECKAELKAEGIPYDDNMSIGIMVETPAAALIADKLAKMVEFFSIGTNDLTQYVLAVDRGNEMIADLYQSLHPAVIKAMQLVIDASHDAGKWTGVCGELAGDLKGALVLLGLGLDEFSMSAGSIPAVKNMIRKANYAEVKQGIAECMALNTTVEVEAKLDEMLKSILG